MQVKTIALLCFTLLPALFSAAGQDYLYATGTPVYSTSLPIDHGVVNVNNGEIHLEIPLTAKQQRGDLVLNETLTYDSRIWKIIDNGGTYFWQPSNVPNSAGGWILPANTGSGNITYTMDQGSEPNPCSDAAGARRSFTAYDRWTWTEANGTRHVFAGATTTRYAHPVDCNGDPLGTDHASSYAIDGSGYTVSVSKYKIPTIYNLHGTAYYPTVLGAANPAGTNITDRNGNYWSTDSSGNLLDTSGVAPILTSSSGNQTFYDVLGAGGVRQRYTITMTTVSFNTAFKQSAVDDQPGSFSAIQSIFVAGRFLLFIHL